MLIKEISKDADKLICLIYQGYLEDRESGKSKEESRQLGSSKKIFTRHLIWNQEDVNSTCMELHRAGLLMCRFPDNEIVLRAELTDKAIVYMQNRFKKGLPEVANFLAKLIP